MAVRAVRPVVLGAAAGALDTARRAFIEHSSDPKKWRNAENEEIKRRFRESNFGGLGDSAVYRSHTRTPTAETVAEGGQGKDEQPSSSTSTNSSGTGPGVGVPLGSDRNNQQEFERILLEKDLTNWNQVTYVSILVALLLVALNLLMDVVKPNPSPEYVPYVPPPAKRLPGAEEPQQQRQPGESTATNKQA